MGFANEVSKLFNNKYFLYFMVFLASTNILGYLVTNKLNAVIFFALVSLLTYQFSKNMSVILLIAIIATNFMMSNKIMREGLEVQTPPSLQNVEGKDADIAQALPIVENAKDNNEANKNMKNAMVNNGSTVPNSVIPSANNVNATVSNALSDNQNIDLNNPDLNAEVSEPNAPEGFGGKMGNKKSAGSKEEHFGPRLDYAATIEQSYQNLDSLLGSDSIKQLSTDTQKLMQQQQNLFNTMNQMVPVLEGAQNMLKGFDLKGLTKSLGGISSVMNTQGANK